MAGGFKLRKWAANAEILLNDLPVEDHGLAVSKKLQDNDNVKVLGIPWNPHSDSFKFQMALKDVSVLTRRSFLSVVAKLFDPLGWTAPVTVVGKIIMQSLWSEKLGWDDYLSAELSNRGFEYLSQLPNLETLSVPRWTNFAHDSQTVEIHGFSDASSQAFAAVVYIREETPAKLIKV